MSSIKVNNGYVVKLTALLHKPKPVFMQGNFGEFYRFSKIVRVGKEEDGRQEMGRQTTQS